MLPVKSGWQQTLETLGSIVTPIAAIGLLVAIAYFFWHSKNREELTKALAEATSLAMTRGERIKDLQAIITEKDSQITVKAASELLLLKKIEDLELEDEKRAKTEFRLRAEIADLERQLEKKR